MLSHGKQNEIFQIRKMYRSRIWATAMAATVRCRAIATAAVVATIQAIARFCCFFVRYIKTLVTMLRFRLLYSIALCRFVLSLRQISSFPSTALPQPMRTLRIVFLHLSISFVDSFFMSFGLV